MAEFALVLPILAFLLFAVIQFGIAFNNYITLTDSTRAGARKASASSTRRETDPRAVCIAAVRNSANGLKQADLTADCVSDWEPGSDVVVSATYPYSISLLGLFEKSGTLTSTTTERIE